MSGTSGNWKLLVQELPMFVLTDEYHNRMRIVAPVVKVEEMTPEQMQKCMEANFHTALDVKYAISNNVLWVAFIHPLKELSKEQVLDAVSQVYNAVLTFGTTYSSTELIFPKSEEQPTEKTQPKKKKSKKS